MKKRLNRQDIDRLSEEERILLRKLPGPWRCDDIPLMTISDMIEYLGDNWLFEVRVDKEPIDEKNNFSLNEDLCDHLWSAVREKAKKQFEDFVEKAEKKFTEKAYGEAL